MFGEFDGSDSERMRQIQSALDNAGIDTVTSSAITELLWEKFTFLIGLSATTAVTRAPIGVVRSQPSHASCYWS